MAHRDPSWWTNDHNSAWDRVKAAFRNDWEQTKHDFGGKGRDLDQDVDDTLKQMAGKQSTAVAGGAGMHDWDSHEPAFRYGYGARQHYGSQYPQWNEDVEDRLRRDWTGDWGHDRDYIRRGWGYTGTGGTI